MGGSSGGSPQCQLKGLSGEEQQGTKVVGDTRYTSGYLPAAVHPGEPDTGDDGGSQFSLPFVITSALLLVAALYAGSGAAISVARGGSVRIPHSGS